MLHGELDWALLGRPADFRELAHQPVGAFPLLAVFAENHPAARKRSVALADFEDLPLFWLSRTYNPHYFDRCAAAFAALDYRPDYRFVTPGQMITMERISVGGGFTLLPLSQTGKNRWPCLLPSQGRARAWYQTVPGVARHTGTALRAEPFIAAVQKTLGLTAARRQR